MHCRSLKVYRVPWTDNVSANLLVKPSSRQQLWKTHLKKTVLVQRKEAEGRIIKSLC